MAGKTLGQIAYETYVQGSEFEATPWDSLAQNWQSRWYKVVDSVLPGHRAILSQDPAIALTKRINAVLCELPRDTSPALALQIIQMADEE